MPGSRRGAGEARRGEQGWRALGFQAAVAATATAAAAAAAPPLASCLLPRWCCCSTHMAALSGQLGSRASLLPSSFEPHLSHRSRGAQHSSSRAGGRSWMLACRGMASWSGERSAGAAEEPWRLASSRAAPLNCCAWADMRRLVCCMLLPPPCPPLMPAGRSCRRQHSARPPPPARRKRQLNVQAGCQFCDSAFQAEVAR